MEDEHVEDDHSCHSVEMIRAVNYAQTRGLDPKNPEELARANAELDAMSIKELEDYTDGLRWDAYIYNSHTLQSTAILIDNPELGIPECCAEPERPPWETPDEDSPWWEEMPTPEEQQEFEAMEDASVSQPRLGRLRTALSRARAVLTRPIQDRSAHGRSADTGQDLSL